MVISDLGLPTVDGLTVLQKIRNRKTARPCSFSARRDAVDDRRERSRRRADDLPVKPFAFVELLARVRVLLRRGQPTPERLQVGDLTLDCIRRKVTRPVLKMSKLAPKEFSILDNLMRNPAARSAAPDREHVWDMDYDGLTKYRRRYIRHLRSKIDDKYPIKMIQPSAAFGYMLDVPDRAVEKIS